MKPATFAEKFWREAYQPRVLFMAALLLLFCLLGGHDIWTQEHRWVDIVAGMFYRHDFFHPFLGESRYYDKPLLSYWLIAFAAQFTGGLTLVALRLPSALAGFTAIWTIYLLGSKLKNQSLGLLAGWMLLTTFYFLFWARTGSADMLNLSGSLLSVTWYFYHRDHATFFSYSLFFIILALTSLCKGLVGMMVPLLAIGLDVLLQKSWRQYLTPAVFFGLVVGASIYLLPFLVSSYIDDGSYGQSGLYLVYRENILRYFQPFDHQGPLYTYLIYLPIYLFPWTLFFIPALLAAIFRFKKQTKVEHWLLLTVITLFLFFTLSGSRRSYYVLPIVPFAILFTANWVQTTIKRRYLVGIISVSFILLLLAVDMLPAWYYANYGISHFVKTIKQQAEAIQPWQRWQVVLLDADTKLIYYFNLPPTTKDYSYRDNKVNRDLIFKTWPVLHSLNTDTIYVTRKGYVPVLQTILTNYHSVTLTPSRWISSKDENNLPVAFIPNKIF